jgi:CubicO group peptidase (beta-lactamase class C family)
MGGVIQIDRRGFTTGALALAAASTLGGRAAAQLAPALSPQARAIAAIQAYADVHRRWFNLPGLTVGVTSPSGFASVIHSGFANADARTPVTPDTLFQIGSISKAFAGALLHQFAAEGRFKLSDRIVSLLPQAPLPADSPISVQHLLDHVAGLPGDAPLFVRGGLWTAYAPGAHWHYSNTGYELLGKLAEHVGGKPLARLYAERIFAPLGMRRTRGAIVGADRLLYAQGYEAADTAVPFVRGAPLAPAAWVDMANAAGSIGSTAADMNLFLRSLADAAQGRGGLGLGPEQGRAFTGHSVSGSSPQMGYGNGLMHVSDKGRNYLHHTGGMISFTSAFHLDIGNRIGAFASSTLSAFSDYRPRSLTLFAVQALAAAEAGQPLPVPPSLELAVARPEQYAGRYAAGSRSFEIRAGRGLTLVANGREAALEPYAPDLFGTLHPDLRDFAIKFDRAGGAVVAALWGPETFVRQGASVTAPRSDPALARLAGRYVNDSPWLGTAIVVERGGKLWAGTDTPLTAIGDNRWRVGDESWSPERASFADFIDGVPQTFIFSGWEFARLDV